jgi:UPF0755 protein
MFGRKKTPPAQDPASSEEQPRFAPRSPSEAIKPIAAPPMPPARLRRRRGGFLSAFSGFLTFLIAFAAAALFGIVLLDREVKERGPLQADKVVAIPRNSGTNDIATILEREGVIAQPLLFEIQALVSRQRGNLKAGEFLFKAGTSIDEAVDVLAEGKAILHSVSVPEGLTSEQIVERLKQNEILTGEVNEIPREGTLLPDTYKFERGTTRQQIVSSMQAAQRQMLNQVWARRAPDVPIKTPQELVILASIVEKETGRADERTRVAGVFVNRLNKRMKLQSDPTIVYGLVGGKGTLGRGIMRSEIDKPTPYNTYAIEGLPPGPIANPGRAAMEAVANPSRTKDLYFVADGTGGHAFAETLDQHNRNVARWRQVERARAEDVQVDRVEPDPPPPLPNASAFAPGGAPAVAPPPVAPSPAAPGATPGAPGRQPAQRGQTGPRGRNVDASEGTARDPLLNRNFDLNSPKTVPAVRP